AATAASSRTFRSRSATTCAAATAASRCAFGSRSPPAAAPAAASTRCSRRRRCRRWRVWFNIGNRCIRKQHARASLCDARRKLHAAKIFVAGVGLLHHNVAKEVGSRVFVSRFYLIEHVLTIDIPGQLVRRARRRFLVDCKRNNRVFLSV